MAEKVCPRCDASIPEGEKQCPECKKNLESKEPDLKDTKKVEETLEMIDGETYEVKSGESDSVIENIKKIGSSKNSMESETEVKESDETEEIIVYQCPVCGTEVQEDDKKCPGCGAIFEE